MGALKVSTDLPSEVAELHVALLRERSFVEQMRHCAELAENDGVEAAQRHSKEHDELQGAITKLEGDNERRQSKLDAMYLEKEGLAT